MRSAARDGNGYEFATGVPNRVHVANTLLLPLEASEEDDIPVEETKVSELAAAEAATAQELPAPVADPEEAPQEPQNGNRGNWLSDGENGQGSLFTSEKTDGDDDSDS